MVTHFSYGGTPYVDNFSSIADALIASGIRHIRDGEPGDLHPQALSYLARHGVRHSVLFPIDTTGEQIQSTLHAYGPSVDFVEPANELDLKAATHPDWAAEWRNEQQLLYATVRSDPANVKIVVLGPAPGHAEHAAILGPLDQYEDAGSLHHYPCSLSPGEQRSSISLPAMVARVRATTVSKPIWTTEVGYADEMQGSRCVLDDSTIAKYDPRTLAERWLAGQPRTYFYQFADMGNVRGYNSMGFVTVDGKAKPQYSSLQSMLRLLSDPGPAFAPTPLEYSLGGNTSHVHQLLLQKRDRTYFLLLWLEVPGWNVVTRSPLDVAQQVVTLTLPALPEAAERFTYSGNWTLQRNKLPRGSKTIELAVSDSISFVELHF